MCAEADEPEDRGLQLAGSRDDANEDGVLQLPQLISTTADSGASAGAASVQFVVTRRLCKRLAGLGYAEAEVLTLEPARAAAIVEHSIARPSSGVPADWQVAAEPPTGRVAQKKPKSKHDRFELQFTCNVCEARNSHSISRHAYTRGTVIVTCPGCNGTHLIADHLNWIEDDFKNLEELMAKRGTPVTRVVNDGVAASAAASAAAASGGTEPASGGVPRWATDSVPDRLDGIDKGQADRIRQAVRGGLP